MTYQCGPNLKEIQRQLLYGTLLGGSSIIRPERGKNCYLAMRDQNDLWLKYKVEVLKDFFKLDQDTIKKDKNTFRCYSIAYPVFNEVYKLFYNKAGSKIILKNVLEILTDEAWMVWFIDAGRKSKRKVYLRTHKFGLEGTQIIVDYFNSLECTCEMKQNRNRYEVIFDNPGSHEFLKTIAHKIPDFLLKDFD